MRIFATNDRGGPNKGNGLLCVEWLRKRKRKYEIDENLRNDVEKLSITINGKLIGGGHQQQI